MFEIWNVLYFLRVSYTNYRFDVDQDSLNDHHVSLDILTFKGATTGRIQGYQLRLPRTKQN